MKTVLNVKGRFLCFSFFVYLLLVFALQGVALAKVADAEHVAVEGDIEGVIQQGDILIVHGSLRCRDAKSCTENMSAALFYNETLLYKLNDFNKTLKLEGDAQDKKTATPMYSWQMSVPLPSNLSSGQYAFSMDILTGKGVNSHIVALQTHVPSLFLRGISQQREKWVARGACVLAFLLLCIGFFGAESLARRWRGKTIFSSPVALFSCAIIISFLILVSFGISGSSMRLGLGFAPYLEHDSVSLWGEGQGVRVDEYSIYTPLAIGQYNHVPQFPIVNSNNGIAGQNMLVWCMTGVPVKHISTLVKPSTWGFFCMDLRRALAWYWWFPVFGCMLLFWRVVMVVTGWEWRTSFLLSLLFTFSPYTVAFSFWPAYTVFFCSGLLLSFFKLIKSGCRWSVLLCAVLLGLFSAGFVLILYPPWQITLVYVFGFLALGLWLRDRNSIQIRIIHVTGLLGGIVVAAVILYCWWYDTKNVLQIIQQTVYPGQRTTLTGGGLDLFTFFRGMTNLVSLKVLLPGITNKSEIASFVYLALPLLLLGVLRCIQKKSSWLEICLWFVVALICFYCFIGFPVFLAKWSLWGRVPETRTDIGLGVAYVLLCGILSKRIDWNPQKFYVYLAVAVSISLIWVGIEYVLLGHMDERITVGFTRFAMAFFLFITFCASLFLCLGKQKCFAGAMIFLFVVSIWRFHPLIVAPRYVALEEKKDFALASVMGKKTFSFLTFGSEISAMWLVAAGQKAIDGVFFYPPLDLWKKLTSDESKRDVYNRYQRLSFKEKVKNDNRTLDIESPYPDVVEARVALQSFDFNLTQADILILPLELTEKAEKNPSLSVVDSSDGVCFMQVMEKRLDN